MPAISYLVGNVTVTSDSELALCNRGIPPPKSSSAAFKPLVPTILPVGIGLLSGCSCRGSGTYVGSDTCV